ncbi:MAG: hypothetical protein LBF51_01120 [Zoogloeaceae bacterium]|nr:hypothetical protein [Zoogloeaceae bacterium]
MSKDNLLIIGAAAAAGLLVLLAWRQKATRADGLGIFGIDWHYGPNFEIIKGGYVAEDNIGNAAYWAELGL